MGRQSSSTPPRTPPASWVGRGSIVPGVRRPNGAALSARPHHSVTQPPALTPESMPEDHRLGPSASPAWASSSRALFFLHGGAPRPLCRPHAQCPLLPTTGTAPRAVPVVVTFLYYLGAGLQDPYCGGLRRGSSGLLKARPYSSRRQAVCPDTTPGHPRCAGGDCTPPLLSGGRRRFSRASPRWRPATRQPRCFCLHAFACMRGLRGPCFPPFQRRARSPPSIAEAGSLRLRKPETPVSSHGLLSRR